MIQTEINEALDKLHQELNKLSPAILHIEKATEVTAIVQKIPQLHLDLLEKIEISEASFKDALKAKLEEETQVILNKNTSAIDSIESYVTKLEEYSQGVDTLKTKIKDYIEKLDGIDFPSRLSSIEGDISSISSGFNNLQGSVNALQTELSRMDRELKDDGNSIKSQLKQIESDNQSKFDILFKENNLMKILLFVSIGVSLIAVITNFI